MGRKYKSDVYIACLAFQKFIKPVSVTLEVYFPDNRKRDLDNLGKVIFDSLVSAEIIADDNWQCLPEITFKAMGVDPLKKGKVNLIIEEVGRND